MESLGQRAQSVIGCTVPLMIALVTIPILLAILFPWEPPRAYDAPQKAVVRVIAPEGKFYVIDWGYGESTSSSVEEGRYRDHPLPERAMRSHGGGTELITVDKATLAGDSLDSAAGNNAEPWEGEIYAILYIDGGAVSCDSGGSRGTSASVSWDGHGSDGLVRRICNGYRYWSYLF